MLRDTTDRVTKKEWQAQARRLLHPLDLEDLIRKGILAKKGARYRILKFKEIPDWAFAQVSEISQDARGSMIKFTKLTKKARTQLEKVIGTLPKS